MNDPREIERLLADVLGEGVGFRDGLLHETLRRARRRRRFRQARRAAPVLGLAIVLGVLAWRFFPAGPGPLHAPARPYEIVHTRPLAPAACAGTKPMAPGCVVASVTTADMVSTAAASGRVREISDEDLLALAAPKAVVLVRLGPHSAELIFPDPADREALVR